MKTVVVANPAAAAGRVGRAWGRWQRAIQSTLGDHEVEFTAKPGDATLIVRRAVAAGAERIAIVGGDGSINEAVNGLVGEDGERIAGHVVLTVVPVGTGGDFARSIGMSDVSLETALGEASERKIDLGRAELTGHDGRPLVRHFINISSFGSSGLIVDMVNKTSKRFGAKASFLWGTVKGLAKYENQRVHLVVDDVFDREIVVNTVAVANGRYFGGSMKIAPSALLDDGRFDVVIIGDVGLGRFLMTSGKLYRGEHLGEPGIERVVGREVTATPVGGAEVLIDLDGEQPGKLPVRYRVLPKAVTLLAPWTRAEAASRDRAAVRAG